MSARGRRMRPSGSLVAVTNWPRFLESASEFVEGLSAAEHVGSMFTVRAVLPNCDDTDERPTLVRRVDERLITLFSGKIGTCVDAALEVASIIEADSTSVEAGAGPAASVR